MAIWLDVLNDFEKFKKQEKIRAEVKAIKKERKEKGYTKIKYCALKEPFKQIKITTRDIEYMQALLKHETYEAVSKFLCVRKGTVESVVNKLRNQLGCHTKLEVMAVLPQVLEAIEPGRQRNKES